MTLGGKGPRPGGTPDRTLKVEPQTQLGHHILPFHCS